MKKLILWLKDVKFRTRAIYRMLQLSLLGFVLGLSLVICGNIEGLIPSNMTVLFEQGWTILISSSIAIATTIGITKALWPTILLNQAKVDINKSTNELLKSAEQLNEANRQLDKNKF